MSKAAPFRVEAVTVSLPLAAALAELHAESFAELPQQAWSAGAISTLLATPGTIGLIALAASGEALGFIIGRAIADEGEIITLCVAPTARRQGVAAALVDRLRDALAPCRRILLEVAVTNRPARELYEKLGFLEIGRRRAYYRGDGKAVDALVLARGASA